MTAGECIAVCAACGERVFVPAQAGLVPLLVHEPDCSRRGWSIQEAIRYDDGSAATVTNWPNGTGS